MSDFSQRSLENLKQCDERLQRIAHAAISQIDFTVITGHRTDAEQRRCFDNGLSKCAPGKSKHNASPSLAFDFIPYPFESGDWSKVEKFRAVARILCQCAINAGVSVRWGGTWSYDADYALARFADCDHFELVGG